MPARSSLPPLLVAALLAATALVALAIPAPPAHAATRQLSVMQDDNLLLYSSPQVRRHTLDQMKALGADAVRVTVLWSLAASHVRERVRRTHAFRAGDPAVYPHKNWDRYDDLVLDARDRGLYVYFNVTGPGPRWSARRAPDGSGRRTWRPKVREYARFLKALGNRYSGTYRDENDGRAVLPRIAVWSLWNEPNQGGWLTPQYAYSKIARRKIPMSPVIYRGLYLYGHLGLVKTGHGQDTILAGDTAPMGVSRHTSTSAMRPKRFIRELFCIGRNGRPYTGRAARARRCNALKRRGFPMTGWSHHPYTKDLSPARRDHNRDSITMANIGDLSVLLDNIAGRTGYFARGLPIWSTEFGYETSPPDPYRHTSLTKQAAYDNMGDYLAYQDPRVVAQTQFLLRDVPPNRHYRRGTKRYWFTYQSGLFFANGRPKPSVFAYAVPVHIERSGPATVKVWGQLRFLPNGAKGTAQLQFQTGNGAPLQVIEASIPVTDPLGYFEVEVPDPGPGLWRVATTFLDGNTVYSRRVRVR